MRTRAYLSALFAVLSILGISCSPADSTKSKTPEQTVADNAKKIYPHYLALESRERQMDETVWARELMAQRCGLALENLWDAINSTTNKLEVVIQFPVGTVLLPELLEPANLPHGIQIAEPSGRNRKLDKNDWQRWGQTMRAAGWQLGKVEFRHTRFDPADRAVGDVT